MALNEPRRRTDHCNDQVGRMGREKGSQIAHERFVPLAVAEARDLERHLVAVYRIRRFLSQIRTQIAREGILGLKIAPNECNNSTRFGSAAVAFPVAKASRAAAIHALRPHPMGYSGHQQHSPVNHRDFDPISTRDPGAVVKQLAGSVTRRRAPQPPRTPSRGGRVCLPPSQDVGPPRAHNLSLFGSGFPKLPTGRPPSCAR